MEAISSLKSAIEDLEIGLLKLNKPTYDNIDALMKKIMKTYDITAKQLHYGFRDKHNNQTPDDWIKSQRIKKMKTFREFLEEAYMIAEDAASYERRQANKRARGRKGKTPLYTTRTSTVPGRVEKTPEGKWRLTKKASKVTDKVPSIAAQLGRFKSRGGDIPSVQGGGHGGSGFGYGPKQHSTGGINRGKKKGEQTRIPEPKYNKYQRRQAVAQSKRLRTGDESISRTFIGGAAAEKLEAQGKKSFGAASKSWSEKEKASKEKKKTPSTRQRMAAAAERLGLKD